MCGGSSRRVGWVGGKHGPRPRAKDRNEQQDGDPDYP